jgi:uncharacterized protein (UPF0147 family)
MKQIPTLKPEHRQMIESEGEVHLIEIVYGLSDEILDLIDNTYVPKNIREYNALQTEWLAEEQWLVGTKTGHAPSADEQLEDMKCEKLAKRFRVYYVLTHPNRVKRREIE